MVMPASQARAARPGWRRAAAAALILLLPSLAMAQDAPAPPSGAAARPNARAGAPGMAPLQTEPGDIWAEVRSWTKGSGPQGKAEPARRKPARTTESAERPAEATAPKPRRAAPCAAEEAGCVRKPARPAANPG
jgi:hypothetical protein